MTDYEKYTRTEELLNLQKSEIEMCCNDELTYQTIRQIAELHFKLIGQYLRLAKAYLEADNLLFATNQLRRVDLHLKLLPEVFNLISVIEPTDYQTIRTSAAPGNDYDSPGFIEIIKLGEALWEPFKKILNKKNLSVIELLKQGDANYKLFHFIQELITFDEGFQTLCFHHNKLVRRMNSLDTKRCKELAIPAMENSIQYELFPELWNGISVLAESTFPGYYSKSAKDSDGL
jgi:tryptophan 2,3-dioxygenase